MAYNNNKEDYRPNTYSPLKFTNITSNVAQSQVSFSFWKGMLKLEIAMRKKTADDSVSFDHKAASTFYFSPFTAKIASNQITLFKKGELNSVEVRSLTSPTVIRITKPEVFKAEGPCMVIDDVQSKSDVTMGNLYVFNNSYYGLSNFKEEDFSFDKIPYEELELDLLKIMFDEFVKSSTYAMAHTVIDNNRFNHAALNNKLVALAKAAGIEYKGKNNNQNYTSPFDDDDTEVNDPNEEYVPTNYSDIEDM